MTLIESAYDDDDDGGDEEPVIDSQTIPKGTTFLHGTNGEFEEHEGLDSPVWVTNSMKVATYFSNWKNDDGQARITFWTTNRDLNLAVIDKSFLDYMTDYYGYEVNDPTDILLYLSRKGYDGWSIPDNYGLREGDFCLYSSDCLDYLKTEYLNK